MRPGAPRSFRHDSVHFHSFPPACAPPPRGDWCAPSPPPASLRRNQAAFHRAGVRTRAPRRGPPDDPLALPPHGPLPSPRRVHRAGTPSCAATRSSPALCRPAAPPLPGAVRGGAPCPRLTTRRTPHPEQAPRRTPPCERPGRGRQPAQVRSFPAGRRSFRRRRTPSPGSHRVRRAPRLAPRSMRRHGRALGKAKRGGPPPQELRRGARAPGQMDAHGGSLPPRLIHPFT